MRSAPARCGAAGHIAKPFEAQTLVERVKELLAAPAPAPPAPEPVAPPAPEPVAAAAPEMPTPASAPENPDNSFDFFDDNLDDLSSSSPGMAPVSPASDPLDFGGPDAAFAFGEEDLAAATQEPMPAPPLPAGPAEEARDATVAILPPEVSESAHAEGPSLDPELLNAPTEAPRPMPAPEPAAARPALETDPVAPPQPALETDPVAPPQPVLETDPVMVAPPMPAAPALDPDPVPAPDPMRAAPPVLDTGSAMPSDAPVAPAVPKPTTARSEDDFDFEFETVKSSGAASAAVSSADLAQASVLDPATGNDFDVSSSDLGTPLDAPPPAAAAATQVIEAAVPSVSPDGPPSISGLSDDSGLHNDPVMDLLSPDAVDPNEATLDPARANGEASATPAPELEASPAADPILPGAEGTPVDDLESQTKPELPDLDQVSAMVPDVPPMPEPALAEASAPEPAPAEPMMAEPAMLADPEPAAPHMEPETPADLEVEPVEPTHAPVSEPDWDAIPPLDTSRSMVPEPAAAEAPASASLDLETVMEQVGPALRAQIHETLERIAWESFGQVTEKLVEQSLERVEKIAWEVVPKLAETLIQEEIRKLKNDD